MNSTLGSRLRAFPLWLRVPRCLGMLTAQIPGNEPLAFFLGRGSFLSPGRALRLLSESALAIPTLRFSILCLVCSFRFREWIAIRDRHSSFSHGHPSGKCPRRKYSCLPQLARLRASLPTRACTQNHSLLELNSGIRNRFSSFSALFDFIFFFQSI